MGVMEKVCLFYSAHPKRQRALENVIISVQPEVTICKVKSLCRTRWVQRIDAFESFVTLHLSLVNCMEEISSQSSTVWSTDSVTDARALLLAMSTTDFIAALVIMNSCMGYLRALTCSLQAEAKDVIEAVDEIHTVQRALQSVRNEVDSHHNEWFKIVEDMCLKVGTQPMLPRVCGRQQHRMNLPSNTPSEYFKRSISIPLLDHILSELHSRFSSHNQMALKGMCLIPSVMVTLTKEEVQRRVNSLVELYQADLPCTNGINGDILCWYLKWEKHGQEHGRESLPNTLTQALRTATTLFANIRILIQLLCTLPVTTCSSERSHSGLKRIKMPYRSTMTNKRLTALSLLNMYHDIHCDVEAIIDEFSRRHPRRLRLCNILAD